MTDTVYRFVSVDLLPVMAAVFAAVSCGILGNFLVLRRLSLMGDAVSHSVLPGLVIAFIVAGSRAPGVMFLGAAIAGVATVALVEVVKRVGRVDPGAAMGVVFSVLFALGVVLIEQAAARHVDLDADCVLYGQLETLFWVPPQSWSAFWAPETLTMVPAGVWTLMGMTIVAVVFVVALFKELRIAAFDGALATTQGFHAGFLHALLMVLVAAATVASFEAVGSILVVAMLVCPAATARPLTDRLHSQIIVSVAVAIVSAVGGYIAATAVPAAFGADSINAAGSIAVVSGIIVVTAALASPSHGVIAKAIAHRRLSRSMGIDDVVATVYRAEEAGAPSVTRATLRGPHGAVADAVGRGLVQESTPGAFSLTETGRAAAADVVRRHRLWESYLVREAGMAPDHVHDVAEQLEHLPVAPARTGDEDPHGKPIPPGASGRAR